MFVDDSGLELWKYKTGKVDLSDGTSSLHQNSIMLGRKILQYRIYNTEYGEKTIVVFWIVACGRQEESSSNSTLHQSARNWWNKVCLSNSSSSGIHKSIFK